MILVLPVLIPLAGALGALLTWRRPRAQRLLAVTSMAALLAVAVTLFGTVSRDGIQVAQMGAWPAPFGITLVADLLSAIMLLVTAVTGLAVAIYAIGSIDRRRERYGYHVFYQVMIMGVCGAFLTGDLFNLFVWFEVMLIASFVLMALGGETPQMEGAVKYVTLNMLSSTLFLTALGILYGKVGTLNMADLAVKIGGTMRPEIITVSAVLFLVAFGIKAGIFPLFFWLPASYHTPPVTVSAVFAGLLTKVGVYALIRTFTLIFTTEVGVTHGLLLAAGVLTMATGVLGAVAQFDLRRLLSFHIISQIGYMVVGLALLTPLALTGAVFYLFHHIIVKTNLFLVSGIAHRLDGHFGLKQMGGLYRSAPWLAALFLIPAMSLAGIPPLSGFWAKFTIVKAGLDAHSWIASAVALAVGLLTLFSMTKIWADAFWKANPGQAQGNGATPTPRRAVSIGTQALLYGPVVSLAAITLCIGFNPEPFFDIAARAAEQLLTPAYYIEAVLGPRT
jgi:multicomponent Na+:H+ antiporter subunit D